MMMWHAQVEKAEPETDAKRLEEIKQRQMAYLQYRAEKDPARGMFTRMYGPVRFFFLLVLLLVVIMCWTDLDT